MPQFARAEVWTDVECAGSVRKAIIADPVDLVTTRDVAGDENVQLTVLRTSLAVPELLVGRVLRIVRRDTAGTESADEWRIAERTRTSGAQAATFTYLARSIRFDLARGDIAQVLSTGETQHVFSVVSMTPSEIIDTYVLPALADVGLTWIARGTIDPTATLDLQFEYYTPLSLLEAIRDQTMTELQLRRNGAADYRIDLLTQIGAGATTPAFRYRKNLLENQLVERAEDQVTRCIPRGGRLPGLSEFHTLARVILKVTAVSAASGNLTLTVADPAGAMSPIAFDDQFNGWYVFRQLSGGTFPITDTIKSGQQIVVTSKATIAAGEYLELRSSDPQMQEVAIPRSAPTTGAAALPYAVNGDGVFPDRFTMADAGAGTLDFTAWDGQHADLFAVFCSQVLSDNACTVDGPNGRFAFSVSVASVQVGDLIYYGPAAMAASPPHGQALSSILWEVDSIDAGNKYVYPVPHYANRANEILPNDGTKRVVVIRPAQTQRVVTSFASANSIQLDSNYNGANTGRIVLLEQHCAGVLPAYVDEPVSVASYGVIPRPLDKSDLRGEGNAIPNPRMATWTTPANPPDGWSIAAGGGASAEHSQNTDPTYLKYGVRSWDVTMLDRARGINSAPRTPTFYLNPVGFSDLSRVAFKLSFYLAEFAGDCTLELWLVTKQLTGAEASTRLLFFLPTDTTATTDNPPILAPNQWQDVTIPAIDPASFWSWARASGGFQLQFRVQDLASFPANNPACRIYLDAVAAYQVSYDPGSGAYVDGSFANQLLNAANAQLMANAQPAAEYSIKLIDLPRLPDGSGAPFADDELTLGGQIDLRDVDLGVTVSPRVTRMVVHELATDDTEVTLSTLQPRLTTLLAGGTTG